MLIRPRVFLHLIGGGLGHVALLLVPAAPGLSQGAERLLSALLAGGMGFLQVVS